VSFMGGLITGLYALLPPYIVYVDSLGYLPPSMRIAAGSCMVFIAGTMIFCRRSKQKPFQRPQAQEHTARDAFTLIELLLVISIIGILASLILPSYLAARNAAYLARNKAEFKSIATALELYTNDHGNYPPDANRDLPPGLEPYLGPGVWPKAPWPGSVYDWDNWAPADLAYNPKEQVYQISVRFCPLGQPSACVFPKEPWAQNFDYYSAVYFCVGGPCRPHSSQPINHPGYCLNC